MTGLNKALLIGILIAVCLGLGKLYSLHLQEVEEARQSVITEYSQQDVQQMDQQVEASSELMDAAIKDYKDYAAKVKHDNTRLQLLNSSLQQRLSRSEASKNLSDNSTPSPSHTGAGLYREDGEFLAGEAAYADIVTSERDACYRAYNRIEDTLKELNGKD